MATPAAAAGEGASYAPIPDTLALLMLDSATTFASPALRPVPDTRELLTRDIAVTFAPPAVQRLLDLPELRGFDVRADITPDDSMLAGIAAFEGMRVAPRIDAPFAPAGFGVSRATLVDLRAPLGSSLTRFEGSILGEGARDVVRAAMTRRLRPPRALDGRIVLRIDGKEESPVFSIGGGIPAALWGVLPKE